MRRKRMGFKKAAKLVDDLGLLRAEIKELQEEASAIEEEIFFFSLQTDLDSVYGNKFKANIIQTARKIVPWKKLAIKLGATKRLISANTSSTPYNAIKVVAHSKN